MAYTPFVANTTALTAANINGLADELDIAKQSTNLVVNSNFESWVGEGTSSAPDAWSFVVSGGATIARAAVASATPGWGDYTAQVTHAGAGTTYLLQAMDDLMSVADTLDGEYFTFSANVKAGAGSKVRVSIFDGGAMGYSDYATTSWTNLSVTLQLSAPSALQVGFEFLAASGTCTVSDCMLVRGREVPNYSPSIYDKSAIMNRYNDDGTDTALQGARIVPFKITVTLSGTGTTQTFTGQTIPATLQGKKIIAMIGQAEGATAGTIQYLFAHFYGYDTSGTTYSVSISEINETTLTAADVNINGIAVIAGWEDISEVHT